MSNGEAVAQALRLLAETLESAAGTPPRAVTVTVTETVALGFTAERFALAPPDTRIGVQELTEATGRSRSGIYKLVREAGLPARRLHDNTFVFVVEEVRQYFRDREVIVNSHVPRIRTRNRAIA